MKSFRNFTFIIIFSIFFVSCDKIKEYFKDPEVEPIEELLKISRTIGSVSTIAMSAINENYSNVTVFRSNSRYPCTAYMVIRPNSSFALEKYSPRILVAGYWPDENTAILSVVLPSDEGRSEFSLKNIYTIPVIRQYEGLMVVFAGMDINLDEEGNNLFDIDFTEDEINFEWDRLDTEEADDIYIALEQKAWIIHIDENNTSGIQDDTYTVTGGGQLITATNTTASAYQQAVLDVQMDYLCNRNPLGGYALIQKAAVEDEEFPESGMAIFSFKNNCSGKVKVELATGTYITSIGKEISFNLDR